MELVLPDIKYKESFLAAVEENFDESEQGIGMIGRNYEELGSPETFEDYIQIRNDHS